MAQAGSNDAKKNWKVEISLDCPCKGPDLFDGQQNLEALSLSYAA